ncbi:ATP-dependent DNA helicase RecG, partial [Patescibacteria group bacterium]|nr:ATP-dependent DNA helicase RecG [Patescibacteria group bacterium]
MQLKLSSPVAEVPRVGPAKAKSLKRLGITHARDFLYTFPRRYDDFSRVTSVAQLRAGEKMTVKGKIKKTTSIWGFRGRQRLLRIFVDLADDTGTLAITWYNLRFLTKQLWQGRELFVAGTVEENTGKGAKLAKFRMRSPAIEFSLEPGEQTHAARITPVYPETQGITSRFLRYQVKTLLPLLSAIPEYLPAPIRQRNRLIEIHTAIRESHFPSSSDSLKTAQRRLRFDELFFLQLAALVRRRHRLKQQARAIKRDAVLEDNFTSSLPFELTQAQQVATAEILDDLTKTAPMNRLLQGDVGSGKSVVALAAIHLTLSAGHTVLYLAPTEVLARQQATDFAAQLGQQRVALLIGALSKADKNEIKQRLASGEAICVVGTHALLQGDVSAPNTAFVIVDEQHRFGVAQRSAALGRSASKNITPHLLSMTATPIPRTLSLTVYGDLDISILNELPPGRKATQTKIVPPSQHDSAVIHILEQLHAGRQAYVIAPLIEQSQKLQVKSAKETAVEMTKLFPDIAVGLLHGQLTSEEKAGLITNFAAGAIQLLVATSVVEVGINVPNATVMIIEGA